MNLDEGKLDAHREAFAKALAHSQNCRVCWSPIIRDEEGNPGLFSEACVAGLPLLQALVDAEDALFEVA